MSAFIRSRHICRTPEKNVIISIVVACLTTISLMGVFARHNRKKGWRKSRVSLIDRLQETKRSLLKTHEDEVQFSHALQGLQAAVHRANQRLSVDAASSMADYLDHEETSRCL
jgi:4-alpha-glucanotransferase